MELRHYLQFNDFTRDEYEHLFARTRWIKDQFKHYEPYQPLTDRTLAMIFEKAVDAHAPVVRGRHAPARRLGHLPEHARHAARPRRAGRRRGAGDLAHGRHRHDPHLRAGDHRALRRALARAGDQRPDQRIPPLPDPGRHLHLHRAPRLDQRQDGGLDRRLQQRLQHLAAGGGDSRFQRARVHAARLRSGAGARRHLRHATISRSSPIRWRRRAAPTW